MRGVCTWRADHVGLHGGNEVRMSILRLTKPVLISVDHQKAGYNPNYAIPHMPGVSYDDRVTRVSRILEAARQVKVPVIFIQERHSRTHVDFGRELDGSEGVHCVEDDPETELVPQLRPQPDEYFVPKRRYSAFFGTDLEILLKGLGAETLILCGGLTDVCVHYTFVDAHQHNYRVHVVTDGVGGSSQEAHDASLRAMSYLQSAALINSQEAVEALTDYVGEPRPGVAERPWLTEKSEGPRT